MTSAIRFSNPVSSTGEKGIVLGGAHTRSCHAVSEISESVWAPATLMKASRVAVNALTGRKMNFLLIFGLSSGRGSCSIRAPGFPLATGHGHGIISLPHQSRLSLSQELAQALRQAEDVQSGTGTTEARCIVGIGLLVNLGVTRQLAGHYGNVLLAIGATVADR